jgi:hypothetical protein
MILDNFFFNVMENYSRSFFICFVENPLTDWQGGRLSLAALSNSFPPGAPAPLFNHELKTYMATLDKVIFWMGDPSKDTSCVKFLRRILDYKLSFVGP